MKNVFILACLLTGAVYTLDAQSNAFLDSYLSSDNAKVGDSVYLVLALSGIVSETATIDSALDAIKGWNIAFKDKNRAITLGEFSYLVMKANNMSGGLMYTLFPGPRYAGRELVYEGIVKGDPNPGRGLSGREAFAILRLVLDSRENI